MAQSTPRSGSPDTQRIGALAKRRRDQLRHIPRLTKEQQMDLIEEARAARKMAEGENKPR